MAAGPGSTDAENGVKMAARDRFDRRPPGHRRQADRGGCGRGDRRNAGPRTPGRAAPRRTPPQARARRRAAGDLRGLGLRQRSGPGRLRRGRARHRDQTQAADPGRARRVHPRRLHHRRGAGTVTCPGGHTRPMSPNRTVTFGKLCADCPLRDRCTTAKAGRSMTIHEHEDLLRAARAQARTPEFRPPTPPGQRGTDIVARHPERAPGQAALPRRDQEQRLAAHPRRRAQPAHPDPARADPPGRGLGAGLPASTRRAALPPCLAPPSKAQPPRLPAASTADGGASQVPEPEHPATRPTTGPGYSEAS